MNYAQYIQLAITLVGDVLGALKGSNAEQNAIADVQSALTALLKVQGTVVTQAQLEALRVQSTF